jgi:alpha-tubulin suppressor-like RCC1 family protein
LAVAPAWGKDFRLYVAGGNYQGQLGLPGVDTSPTFVQVPNLTDIRSIGANSMYSMALDGDGILWVTGLNSEGQLGLGDQTQRSTFTAVSNPTNIKSFAPGSAFSLVIDENDEIWSTGYNYYGGLGLGDNSRRTSFQKVSSVTEVEGVVAMNYSSVAWHDDGVIYSTGFNSMGELGQGDRSHRNSFEEAEWVRASAGSRLAAGGEHFLVVLYDGTVHVTGWNSSGQLGLGDNIDTDSLTYVSGVEGVVAAAAGFANSFVIKNNGTVMATGRNDSGELGLGDMDNRNVFTAVPGLTDVSAIAPGFGHTLTVKNDGTLWAAGANGGIGKLGLPKVKTTTSIFMQVPDFDHVLAVAAGTHHSMALAMYGVEVTYPNDIGVTLERGKKYEITWDSYNLPKNAKVKIELIKGGSEMFLLSAGASKSPFKWTVGKVVKGYDPYPDGDDYKIRITAPAGDDMDESDFEFAIGTVEGLLIAGASDMVGGGAPQQYTCTAQFNYGDDQDVTSLVKWNTDLGKYAKMGKTGLLTTKPIPSDMPCNILATYKAKPPVVGTKDITILAEDP